MSLSLFVVQETGDTPLSPQLSASDIFISLSILATAEKLHK